MRVSVIARLAVLGSLVALSAAAQGTGVLTGVLTDAATHEALVKVVVTATSPALQGEEIVVSDAAGHYRLSQLPAGTYALRFEGEGYKTFTRTDITLRNDKTIRLNVELQPESIEAEEQVVTTRVPIIDVGSTQTGLHVGKDFIDQVPFIQPNASGTRSFESVAHVAPQVTPDAYGPSINGASSPENAVLVDGVSVTDPALGGLQRPTASTNGNRFAKLSSANVPVEFLEEVNVITGAYLPEHGRAGGGVISAVTKSGSNEFHGSVFGTYTPGALQGPTPRVRADGSSIELQALNFNTGDFGAELGGPLIKDRLWFYAGFAPSMSRERIRRTLYRLEGDGSASELPGGTEYRFRDGRAYNYLAKLTLLISPNQNLAVSLSGAPKSLTTQAFGATRTAGTRDSNDNSDLSVRYTGAFFNKALLFDATFGWHHQEVSSGPDDATEIGAARGGAGTPAVVLRSPNRSILDLERLNPDADALCRDDTGAIDPALCPAGRYVIGGAGFMEKATLDRVQAKASVTWHARALGHHAFKAGLDYARSTYDSQQDYSGGFMLTESRDGRSFAETQLGYFSGPDELVRLGGPGTIGLRQRTMTNELGAYVQDSWSLLDVVTLNAGLRYDTQQLYRTDGSLGLTLNNMFSPRVGLIYDFTGRGQSKVFASYARYYQSVPLAVADRGLSPRYEAGFVRAAAACDPAADLAQASNECQDPASRVAVGSASAPNAYGVAARSGSAFVDPAIQAQATDEYVVGGEYELVADGRLGAMYTHRNMNAVIEDFSRDEGGTLTLGTPGLGLGANRPKAIRDYDAITFYFSKAFSDLWQAQLSYTWSQLSGNYSGYFRPETEALEPHGTPEFDTRTQSVNSLGKLPGDTTHVLKAYGSKEFVLSGTFSVVVGLSYTGRSGRPISYLSPHPVAGDDETYVLPRGTAGRTPWVHQLNLKLVGQAKISDANAVQLTFDMFNMFNFNGIEQVDQTFSGSAVVPYAPAEGESPQAAACIGGNTPGCTPKLRAYQYDDAGQVVGTTGASTAGYNPNFKQATLYQQPLSVRFGLRVTF